MRLLCFALFLAGCVTAPVAAPTAEQIADREAEQEQQRRDSWLQANQARLDSLANDARALAGRTDTLEPPSWRGGSGPIEAMQARCEPLLSDLGAFAAELQAAEAEHREPLPGLPAGWASSDAAESHRAELVRTCDELPPLLTRWQEAEATRAQAEAARDALEKRTGRAARAVATADATLRDIVGDPVFVAYLDSLDGWQRAATVALRESRRPEPDADRLARARRGEADAQSRYEARHAAITLAISGRSAELLGDIDRAVKSLRRLGDRDRAAVLALFPPEVTPASPILLQFLEERL